MMLRVGLTGGIGSGKTTVAAIFELLGIPVYYADDEAKLLMQTNEVLKAAIGNQFGAEAYKNGQLDRGFLANQVFSDPGRLEMLNALVHPATIRAAADWMAKQESPYTIKEAALIFESGSAAQLDYVIGVSAPAPLRITRAAERSKLPVEAVMHRMDRQLDEVIKMKLCDFVLKNDEQQLLIPQVIALHNQLLAMAVKS
jgi:dephospho-CoA kinase